MAIKVKTKAPSGLTITRAGKKFTYSWKIADKDYGKGQQIQFHIHPTHAKGVWYSLDSKKNKHTALGASVTSKAMTIDMSKYYPHTKKTLDDINFRVRGCRNNYSTGSGKSKKDYAPTWSDYPYKRLVFALPNVPTMTTEWDAEHNNECTFLWNTSVSTDGAKHFADVELQSILVKDCTETDGSKLTWKSSTLGWATATYGANGSRKFTEDSATIAGASYTRWVRVRSRGCKGASAWRYAKHVYAAPYQAKVNTAKATETKTPGYICDITWTAQANAAHPIDQTTVGYYIGTPANNLECPAGVQFTSAETSRDTAGKDKANFEVGNRAGVDQCMWLRVDTQHDDKINLGIPSRVAVGVLSDPDSVTATPTTGYTVTVNATNRSSVPDSFLVVVYRRKGSNGKWETNPMTVGIIPAGQSSTSCTVPAWNGQNAYSFGVYAVQGSYKTVTRTDGITQYTVTANTRSKNTVWTENTVPKAPTGVTVEETSENGKVLVSWNWSWATANAAEISWSDDKNAWQSTTGFNSYKLDDKQTKWYIPGLEMGKKWYVRVRLMEDEEVSPWSSIVTIDLATTPITPRVTLSEGRIAISGSFTISWTYGSRDGTGQTYAEITTCTIEGETITNTGIIAKAETSQAAILYPSALGWEAGEDYNLRVRVTSASGKKSEWSDPVTISIAEPLECVIEETSLTDVVVPDDDEEGTTRTVLSLTEMPMTVTVTGAGEGGITAVYIERREGYHMDRPDETDYNGYEGEAVCVIKQSGEDEITITNEDVYGSLDDGAKYRLVAIVSDGLGQSDIASENFEVHWAHQAIIPTATIEVDEDNLCTIITPVAPAGTLTGDVFDIYRLSCDRPELVVEDGEFGETYVDPYPALNEHGGHRVVFKTKNGDYITEDNQPAWTDYTEPDGNILPVKGVIIDFNGDHVRLPYNLDISSAWKKDFTETHYLGGSVQGDWNMGVSRTSSINTSTVVLEDPETIVKMRRLAVWPGICHVRTPEGSSYAADVQVSESMSYEKAGKIAEFSLSVSRVDAEELDGVLYDDWEATE